ncbi:MAG: response regulator [Opitutaceae bacterium]|jgi:PAS domain S-box-containing protein
MSTSEYRILVADDDARGLLFLQGLLSSEGYTLYTATDGAKAIAVAEKEVPDAILLDVMMPGMDGFEACRRLRAHPTLNQIPIILLTALDDRESRLEGLEAGADDFLAKPFDSTELLIRLRTITRLNRFRCLSEERMRFEHVIAYSPDGIVIIDNQNKILLANREFARLAGLEEPVKAVGQDFFDWLNKEDGALLRKTVASTKDGERSPVVEVRMSADIDPEPAYVEITASLLPWQGSSATQLVLRDMSEQKRMETQVMRSQRIDLLGELAGSVAHDMNNVLSAVTGNLSLLEMQMDLSEEARKRMGTVQQSLQRGHGILRQLLAFTRGSDGTLQQTNLKDVVKEVVDLITPMMKYDYQIEVSLGEDLPPIMADSNQLHQVLMNLCINGRDAMPEGGTLSIVAHRLSLTEDEAIRLSPDARAGDFIVIHVRDTGTGMPPEVRSKIFAPFFTTKPVGKGTGLGLATVLRIARRHKGFIAVDSVLKRGTCFSVFLPVN